MTAKADNPLREALEQIRDHWACQYDHPRKEAEMYRGPYGIGVTDGHRACAEIATAALASEPVAGTDHTEPHPRWKIGDKSGRHPQTVDEWDYRKDPFGEALDRGVRRLNVATDYDDPRAPDQMAIVLRIDLMRLMGDWTHKNAAFQMRSAALSAPPAPAGRGEIARIIERECYVAGVGDGYHVSGIEQAATAILSALPPQVLGTGSDSARYALLPFAKIADQYAEAHNKRVDRGKKMTPHPDSHRVSVALGDCRQALIVLSGTPEPKAPTTPAHGAADRAEWQPIETAPKDGTKIDLLFPYPRGRQNDCQWRQGGIYGDGSWCWSIPQWGSQPGLGIDWHLLPESEWETGCYPNMEPTHWMTPPSLPRAVRGADQS